MHDTELTAYSHYRNAVERGWDPSGVDLSRDVDALAEAHEEEPGVAEYLKGTLAKFGAGEEAVTEDLAPFTVVLSGIEDQMFLTTQMYDEAKHAEFFDRYWREVVHEAEDRAGVERTYPDEERWFPEGYVELFERNAEATDALLEDDTPENRVRAYCHYHLTIEGILAQAGYWWLTRNFGDGGVFHLPGLVEGVGKVRGDEGRHVGFGVERVKRRVADGVPPDVFEATVNDLLPLVQDSLRNAEPAPVDEDDFEEGRSAVVGYAADRHSERVDEIRRAAVV